MSNCMRCGVGINEKNYVFSWTLMCKDCDTKYNNEQREKIKREREQTKQVPEGSSGCLGLIIFIIFIGYYLLK